MGIIKEENGLKKGLGIHILKDIGTYSVKRSKNSILGININDVLKIKQKRLENKNERRKDKRGRPLLTKRETRNYIFMGMGLTVIFLILLFHLVGTINNLLSSYNRLVDRINIKYNETMDHRSLIFFGESVESINLLVDIIIVFVIIIIFLMVYLRIRWSVKK